MHGDHACPCGRVFSHREHLNRHKLARHSQRRPHVCDICDRAFARSDVLRQHRLRHRDGARGDGAGHIRVAMACDRCHLRKERCSGGVPCARCQVSGSECFYTRVSSLSSPKHVPPPHASARPGRASIEMAITLNEPFEDKAADRCASPGPGQSYQASPEACGIYAPLTGVLPASRPNHNPGTLAKIPNCISRQPAILSIPDSIRTFAPLLCAETRLSLYFTEFAPSWPVLHRGRFLPTVEQQPLELLLSVALIGTLFDKEHHAGSQAKCKEAARSAHAWLLENLGAYLSRRREEGSGCTDEHCAADLAVAQALLLNVVYGISIDHVLLRVRLFSSFGMLVEWIREAGLFDHDQVQLLRDADAHMDEYERWIVVESRRRLVFAAFRLDGYMSLFYDRAPVIRFQEVRVPLMCSSALWDTAHLDAWRAACQLEPIDRLHTTFSSLCAAACSSLTRNTIPVLLEEDYELALCAMQPRLWEDARQHHEQAMSAISLGPGPDDGSMASIGRSEDWNAQLEDWRTHRDRSQHVNALYSSPTHRRHMRFNGAMMYLLSYLRMHADIILIRRLATTIFDHRRARSRSASASVTRNRLELRVTAWAESRNARIALRCAAQMFQLCAQEVEGVGSLERVDPVGVSCLFRAALVVWAYARSTLLCNMCASVSTAYSDYLHPSFSGSQAACELAVAEGDLDMLDIDGWISSGGNASINNVPVCACCLSRLIGSFVSLMRKCAPLLDFVRPLEDVLEDLKYCQ